MVQAAGTCASLQKVLSSRCTCPAQSLLSRHPACANSPPGMVFSLTCAVQTYDWGIVGVSEVAGLGEANTGVKSDDTKPHAELWMGTHPSGPSLVKETGVGLFETIASDAKEFLGEVTLKRFGPDLPFLTKVLSVAKALSIQAHPDKALAKQLHAARPDVYKDGNHKPEMTLAITEFEALCGFVDCQTLVENLQKVPELREVTGQSAASAFVAAVGTKGEGAALKDLFKAVMTASEEVVTSKIQNLVTRLTGARETNTEIDRLAIRLERQYPGDVGVLCAYLLNYVVLQPGQCIYLAANEPHAYLKGECVECMATSDNVVRAGLTPKLRDTEILCDMLTYKTGASVVLDGEVVTCESSRKSVVKQYHVPFDEFQLETYVVPSGETCAVETSRGPCVLLVTKGKGDINGEQIQRGAVVFAKAGEEIVLHATEDVFAYRAMINKRVF